MLGCHASVGWVVWLDLIADHGKPLVSSSMKWAAFRSAKIFYVPSGLFIVFILQFYFLLIQYEMR